MSVLQYLKIVSGKNQSSDIFESFCPDFRDVEYKKPSDYIADLWSRYKKTGKENNNLNGKIFELILATLLWRENILPLFLQAKVVFVPNCNFDLLLYCKEVGPICLSAKTSLRERYKQADLESTALKYVHRKSLSYLITLDVDATRTVKNKIKDGDIIGINNCVLANSGEFDSLINTLKQYNFEKPNKVEIIEATNIVG
jgi:hypothetical protein